VLGLLDMSQGDTTSVVCGVREARRLAGLSQRELAERVGVSRQALVAIEGGRQVPSTRLALLLARSLGVSVDALFRLDTALLSVPGAHGRVLLGQVDGRWVAHAAPSGVPADGYVEDGGVRPLRDLTSLSDKVFIAGCAPLLGLLSQRVGPSRVAWIGASSRRALDLLDQGRVHIAGLHRGDGSENADAVRARFGDRMRLVNLTRWRQGLVVPADNPKGIHGLDGLSQEGLRFARREAGSGAARLVQDVPVNGPLARGHAEVAAFVAAGAADAGVAVEAVAVQAGLGFVPLTEERFDLVLPRGSEERARALLDTLVSAGFRQEADWLGGYDMRLAGS
jgi:putative molybdopterin biosynthesis protein